MISLHKHSSAPSTCGLATLPVLPLCRLLTRTQKPAASSDLVPKILPQAGLRRSNLCFIDSLPAVRRRLYPHRSANSVPLPAPPLLTLEAKEQSGSDPSVPGRSWRYQSGWLATFFLSTVSQTFCNWPMISLTCCNLKEPVCKIWPDL